MQLGRLRKGNFRSRLFATALAIALCAAATGRALAQTAQQGAGPAARQGGQLTSYPGGKWEPGPAKFGAEVINDVSVRMDDGVVLNASVAFPTDLKTGKRASGRFPVVVEHMPYVQFAAPVTANTYFAEHGYISALVRARGLGKSGGEV